MHVSIDLSPYRFTGENSFVIARQPNRVGKFYEDKKQYRDLLGEFRKEIDELQRKMYAHNRYSLLLVFQAMDAAGKDGTIRHIMSGINPHGVEIHSFKRPSEEELDHDFLWRTSKKAPRRGHIGIFNRSYYEEVLVVKVHPSILTEGQRIPKEFTEDLNDVWENRYQAIRDFEEHLHQNGTQVIKFFLNLSKDEQRDRFIDRIDRQEKNWKFSEGDVKERAYWDDYQRAYEEAINETATPEAPWYAIPADDKKNMRLMVCQAVLDHLKALDMHYPQVSEERKMELEGYKKQLLEEK